MWQHNYQPVGRSLGLSALVAASPIFVLFSMLAVRRRQTFSAAQPALAASCAVAFGSIGIPVVTLSGITGISALPLSAMVGRICAIVSLIIPCYLIVIMAGVGGALEVAPAIVICGLSFAGVQFYVSNYMGPELTDILSSLTCIGVMVFVLKLWKPKSIFRLAGDKPVSSSVPRHTPAQVLEAWLPYILLVVFVLMWGYAPIKAQLEKVTMQIPVPSLHNEIIRMPPVTAQPAPYAAVFTFHWLSSSGTSCLGAILAAALLLRVRPRQLVNLYVATFRQLSLTLVTIACMLGLAYLMNYAGMTSTLGL